MTDKFEAGLTDLLYWSTELMMSRSPDFVISHNDIDYLRRWWIVPRNKFANVYLHKILKPDDPRALHDHPWDNSSLIIKGRYLEITPVGEFVRTAGDIINRSATDLHRLELIDSEPIISLFRTGPVIREWGFQCPQGWRHWKEFTGLSADGKESTIGRGCED